MATKRNGDGAKPGTVAEEIEKLWDEIDRLQRELRNVLNAIGHIRRRVRRIEGHDEE